MQTRLLSNVLLGAAELIERLGGSSADIAERAGVDHAVFFRGDLEVTPRQINNVMEGAAAVCRERCFSAKLAKLRADEEISAAWPTLGEPHSVKDILNYFATNMEPLSEGAASAILLRHDDGVSLFYEVRRVTKKGRPLHDSLVQIIEFGMASICIEVRRLLGPQWQPRYVQLRHASPDDPSPLKTILGRELYFNQDSNSIFMDEADYQFVLDRGHGERDNHSSDTAKRAGSDVTAPLPLKVTRSILKLINLGDCSLDRVAADLSIRPRTLQYRLRGFQTSYQRLYDTARYELARQYLLKSDLTSIAIAERLGFTDLPAFSNFFKRHSGVSPVVFRSLGN